MNKTLTFALLAGLLALLSACGGGDDLEEERYKSTQPVDCKATPDRCI